MNAIPKIIASAAAAVFAAGGVAVGVVSARSNVGVFECEQTAVVFEYGEPTLMNPDPPLVGATQHLWCGYRDVEASSRTAVVRDTFYHEMDLDAALQILEAAEGLVDNDDDIWLP